MTLALGALATLAGLAVSVVDAQQVARSWSIIEKRTCSGVQTEYDTCPNLDTCDCKPQNCELSAWGDWFEDTTTCSGLCYRQRTVARESNTCGTGCQGPLVETKECILPRCKVAPRNCELSPWSNWNMAECRHDEDQMSRYRTVKTPERGGGKPCAGITNQTIPCTPDLEKVNCQFDAWSPWTDCSKACDIGRKTRFRAVGEEAAHGGATCNGGRLEVANCSTQACGNGTDADADCALSEWGKWIGCDSNSPNQEQRKRTIAVKASGKGTPCNGTTVQLRSCDDDPDISPKDCQISDWTPWGTCDKTCDGGQKTRMRTLLTPDSLNVSCIGGPMRELAACGEGPCHVAGPGDCKVADWKPWTHCSNPCGEGIKTRVRELTAATTGEGCKAVLEEVEECEGYNCLPKNCKWGDWDTWSACSATCDGGVKRRNRGIEVSPTLNGTLCAPNAKSEVAACGTDECDKSCKDGEWTRWSSWSQCSTSCDEGYMSRHRNVHTVPNNCGKPAEGLEQEYKECPDLPECVPSKDCEISDWHDWSDCTCSCYGIKERHRVVITYKQGRGKPCSNESLKEIVPCNPGTATERAPPGCDSKIPRRDCQLDKFSDWSDCSVTCGRGQKYRTRHILVPPSHGGTPCDKSLQQTKECSMHTCGDGEDCIDCKWSAWSDWGGCLKADQRWRHRRVETMPNHCGIKCGYESSKEIGTCTSTDGPRNTLYCAWTTWSADSECPAICGTATRGRHRHLEITVTEPKNGKNGYLTRGTHGLLCQGDQAEISACPVLTQCKFGCVPRDCSFQRWSMWTAPHPEGLCYRTRQIKRLNNDCGKPCSGVLADTKECTPTNDIVLDCHISEWTEWSQCNHANQQKYRIRTIRQMPQGGGEDCTGPLRETMGCGGNGNPPMDCTMTDWSAWTECSSMCGWGAHIRTRRIATPNLNGGAPCDYITEELQACKPKECDEVMKDCEISEWEDWGHCDNDGQRMRAKQIVQEAKSGGAPCLGDLEQTAGCATHVEMDCELSEWVQWSTCSRTCRGGQQTRFRQVQHWPQFGGAACDPEMDMTEAVGCNEDVPCQIDSPCQISSWAEWSPCSVSCGAGQRTRWRNVTSLRQGNGAGCEEDILETSACHITDCEVQDCLWGGWIEWSTCSKHCNGGQQKRDRIIQAYPKHGGKECVGEKRVETRGCNEIKCNRTDCIDAEWADWSKWEPCSKPCRGGITWRNRQIASTANSCGKPVEGKTQQVASCNSEKTCDVDSDCKFDRWSDWGACSLSCNGIMRRTRKILDQGSGDGSFCIGPLSEIKACSPAVGEPYPAGCPTQGTKVDCDYSLWSAWTFCSAPCGQGQTFRERVINQTAQNGGKGCNGAIKEIRTCNLRPCNHTADPCDPESMHVLDCLWQDWGEWGACDKCPGQKYRHRFIAHEAKGGGRPCKMDSAEESVPCPRNCLQKYICSWAEWGSWSACSATCEGPSPPTGSRTRQRQLMVMPDVQAARLYEAGFESEESLDDTLQELKGASARRTKEIVGAFTAGMAGFAIIFMVGSRLMDRKRVLGSSQPSNLRTGSNAYTPMAASSLEEDEVPDRPEEGIEMISADLETSYEALEMGVDTISAI